MEWYTPNHEFKFVLSREFNQLWVSNNSQFICIIDIYNNLNVKLFTIRFTEIDILYILEQIVTFIDYTNTFSPNDITYIHTNTNNTSLSNFTISLSILSNFDDTSNAYQKSVYYNSDTDEYRDIHFSFLEYNPIYERLIPRLSIVLSISELFDFCFHLFFEFLIDIDIPVQYQDSINYLAKIFVSEQYVSPNKE